MSQTRSPSPTASFCPTTMPPPSLQNQLEDDEWPTVPELHISTRGKVLRVLTFAQHASGVLFSTFLLVHLIPPAIVAVTGDESSGSAFMVSYHPSSTLRAGADSCTSCNSSSERSASAMSDNVNRGLRVAHCPIVQVYYQGNISEPLLIYGSLGVHAICSAARRIFYPRSLPVISKSAHSWTGYLAIPFVAIHLQLHRWIPSSTSNFAPSH